MPLCEEVLFSRFAVSTELTPAWLSVPADNLPGTKVKTEHIERINDNTAHKNRLPSCGSYRSIKTEPEMDMVRMIIQDMVTLVNSGHYGHFGGRVGPRKCRTNS